MSSRFNTVRMKYIYICGASALLSIVILFVVYQLMKLIYLLMFHDVAWIERVIQWGINHIGKTPLFLLAFGALFALFFWIRSQKIAEDIQQLVRGTHQLANGQTTDPIRVLSSGELRQLSEQINAIAALAIRGKDGSTSPHVAREAALMAQPPTKSEPISLPIELTLYGIQSALEELLKTSGRHDSEVQHWARVAYEQTSLLQLALGISEWKENSDSPVIKGESEEAQC